MLEDKPTIDVNPVQTPTGGVIAEFTIESNGNITWGGCMEGPTMCGMMVCNVPVTATQSMVECHWKRGRAPLWWNDKLQQLVESEMIKMKVRLKFALDRSQKYAIPSGRRTDL
jgi:hypothetical protein